MVLARHSRHATFTPAQVSGFYFRPCRDEYDEVILEYYRCRCGGVGFAKSRCDPLRHTVPWTAD
ncbi:hypothetical protein F442_23189 [Phytophthora nicotianae P10297]|uniref:Uncharacterized protein n=1 Tax=Phytophthora nicotianae P10297 TaxID=1317064 RepID=W2XYS0_PHYNI|nr:hypothetical protein F442_23189 [Phytophthora nicotianae P10297]